MLWTLREVYVEYNLNMKRDLALNTVIDVITAPEKINSTFEWRIRAQKIAFSPSWRLYYGGAYVQQLDSIEFVEKMRVV